MATEQENKGTGAAQAAQNGSEAADNFKQEMQEYISESIDNLQKMAGEYFEKLGEVTGQASERAGKLYEDSQQYVRKNPGSSSLGAFAFGVLIGVLIRR